MMRGLRVGTVVGVPVAINWSVIIIFVLIAAGLSLGRFPATYPGQPAWAYVVAGVVAAVVFLLGLLAHEVSHAVVARRNGLRVRTITLWVFGGVAELEDEAASPGAEMRIAGVGPLVSLMIGVVCFAVAVGLVLIGQSGLAVGAIEWLGGINLALGVFNLLPAAPLDGGRLLRAALWTWRGDRVWATVVAARSGLVLGWILIALGLWGVFAGGGLGGLWLVLIGWFLLAAAAAEERQARLGSVLSGMRVADIMSAEPQTAPSDVSVAEFIDRYVFERRHTAFPLVEDGRPVGLATLDRARRVPTDLRGDTPLRDVACSRDELVLTVPDESLSAVLPRLHGCADGRALVLDSGRLVGIISPSDVKRAATYASLPRR